MERQITLEEYIKSNHPDIYQAYKNQVSGTAKLTVEDICNMQLDTNGLSAKAVSQLKELDISTVGKLLRVLVIYGSIEWVDYVGVATTNRLHDLLSKYEVNVKEPSLTSWRLREYAMKHCRRNLDVSLSWRLDKKTAEVLKGMNIILISDVIEYLKENESFDMVKSLAGYQRDNIMRLLNQYAKYPECVQYEFI